MDMKVTHKSLPPLVEGKIHGYLKLVIDEVIWAKRSLGEIRVILSWWGETDRAQFRPADITKNVIRSQQEITTVYAIRTNINLFEEYIKNCESVELVIISEETNIVIGTSQITDLFEILKCKSYFKYVPMINNFGNKIGEIHISMKLEYVTKSSNMQLKTCKNHKDIPNDKYATYRKLKSEENEIYKSILKSRRSEFQQPVKKFNNELTDKLVAQVVARAQRLRGALLKETYNEDVLSFNDNSVNNNLQPYISIEDEVKLCEYLLGNDMTFCDETKALCTSGSTSITPSLIDLTSNGLNSCRYDNKKNTSTNISFTQTNSSVEEILSEKKLNVDLKENALFNHIDYIRVFVRSFILSPAGYRRVKSSSLSHNDNIFLSATYFVQYSMTFDYIREMDKKWIKENKPVKICSKKQADQVIYFNHNAIYGVSKLKPYTEYFIKFKVLVRHFNKKSLIELGAATMHINDIIRNKNWSLTQSLIIINKGIKIGELNILIELSSDSSHFRQHIDGIISTKENIPILETQQLPTEDRNKRSKNSARAPSKTNSQVPSTSTRETNSVTTNNDLCTVKDVLQYKVENVDDKKLDIKNDDVEDKVLLHGLIYVAEGKELPELNTYLICRAFWREDKTRSQICNNTTTPFYQFCQLVPLIYGNDLLNRIKDNYIIIEVYYRNNNLDNLLGLAKLPVHQFYIAYRDPRVLPHLLLSTYPVVSVDGWIPIIDPVSDQFHGQLLVLVALGTAEQIALLEMSKGLQTVAIIPQTIVSENFSGCTKHLVAQNKSKEIFVQNNSQVYTTDTIERKLYSPNLKTQECQTDISTVKELKFNSITNKESQEEISNSEYSISHTVGYLTQAFNKANIDQAAQTETDLEEKKRTDMDEQMCIDELYFNNGSDDSDNNSSRHNFHLPTETYRSVGVGAEYDEECDQQPDIGCSNATFNLPSVICTENESTDFACSQTMFRAIVEIECALHLPKVEKVNETIEPSTYVSFQANKSDLTKHSNSYIITNVCPYSCNPKWNWKCDTKLPMELLLQDEKRLILKIWRILDTDVNMQINLERDIVIGFSAIDLSTLISGFPIVSGWFHIMDFTGKCNGQIKVCVTPLDNLSLFGKPTTLNTTRVPTCTVSQLNGFLPYTYEICSTDIEKSNINYTSSVFTQEEDKSLHNESQLNDNVTHIGFEDVSMSFLSLSLKQKLTELDEITKRLESRLRDVTNTAFEDDFENEFDLNELNSDNENNDHKTVQPVVSIAATNYSSMMCQISQLSKSLLHNTMENENQNILSEDEIQNHLPETYTNCNRAISYEITKSGSSKVSNFHRKQNLSNSNCHVQHQNDHLMQNIKTSNNTLTDYPERGTKTHINYLLDKLSLQLPVQSHPAKAIPIKRNVTNLLTNLQQNNTNLQDNNKCNQEFKMCTVPTQTDKIDEQNTKNSENQIANSVTNEKDNVCSNRYSPEISTQSQVTNRMSTVIREELIAEEGSNTSRCDELTTYLVASNIRHMDLNNIFNPLLYQHLVPDLHHSNSSSEEETVEQLDNRYSKAFTTSTSNRLNKVQSLVEVNMPPESTDFFKMIPSGVSENVNDSIDLTVLHKSSYNDLLASNSTESTTTISAEKSLIKLIDTEVTENSCSISSETSVLSRQAPDGGNPIEDIVKPLTVQQKDETQDSLLNSYN